MEKLQWKKTSEERVSDVRVHSRPRSTHIYGYKALMHVLYPAVVLSDLPTLLFSLFRRVLVAMVATAFLQPCYVRVCLSEPKTLATDGALQLRNSLPNVFMCWSPI